MRGHRSDAWGKGHGKLQNWKKAVVTLKAGDDIQFYDDDSTFESTEPESTGSETAGGA